MHLALFIVNQNGSLVYDKVMLLGIKYYRCQGQNCNETKGTGFLSNSLLDGINEVVTDNFRLLCFQSFTGIKFILVSEPHRKDQDQLILSFLALTTNAAPKHGSERIHVKKEANDKMEFKSFSGNETEQMFQTVKGDEMNLTMQEANVSMSGYVSEEVKLQQSYHYYNNTNFFVTFRQKYLKEGVTTKQLANSVVKDELGKHPDKISSVKIKKLYQTYGIFELGDLKELKVAAELLSYRQEILASEYLQKKKLFGRHADLDEMAKFKSKIRKEEPKKKEEEKKEEEKKDSEQKQQQQSENVVPEQKAEEIIQRPSSERFLKRVLNIREIDEFKGREDQQSQSQFLASRWALKEALVKASGNTSLFYPGIYLQKLENSKPIIVIEGDQNKKILFDDLKISSIHSSISHEDNYATAVVILEAMFDPRRPATRIELKIEEDLQEYDEFKSMLQKQREKQRLQNMGSAFGMHGSPNILGFTGGVDGLGYDQIASYASYYKDKNQGAGQRKKKNNNNQGPPNMLQGFNSIGGGASGIGGSGINDDSMNDSF
ncbi:4-phosphopantetheinyl transferase [Stylonychia lemnae]|uniref:4-phosphopantetheinyl transferase n=1 Tax=Stylonychia lemnae TaxID=5949 RepID=A0A078B3D2_STYLE|nr:4-phosphopantetheinyl transferase [Stylonychia lemnae]|eukprot:CDW89035.1 4-phosphopantetheinyl transferase [Stylonychia lemnae]